MGEKHRRNDNQIRELQQEISALQKNLDDSNHQIKTIKADKEHLYGGKQSVKMVVCHSINSSVVFGPDPNTVYVIDSSV